MKAAIEYANKMYRQTTDCPREVQNPGLYFGYMAGYEAAHTTNSEQVKELQKHIEELDKDKMYFYTKYNKLLQALNDIAIMGCGASAYTKDFTEDVMSVVRDALDSKTRWPY